MSNFIIRVTSLSLQSEKNSDFTNSFLQTVFDLKKNKGEKGLSSLLK